MAAEPPRLASVNGIGGLREGDRSNRVTGRTDELRKAVLAKDRGECAFVTVLVLGARTCGCFTGDVMKSRHSVAGQYRTCVVQEVGRSERYPSRCRRRLVSPSGRANATIDLHGDVPCAVPRRGARPSGITLHHRSDGAFLFFLVVSPCVYRFLRSHHPHSNRRHSPVDVYIGRLIRGYRPTPSNWPDGAGRARRRRGS